MSLGVAVWFLHLVADPKWAAAWWIEGAVVVPIVRERLRRVAAASVVGAVLLGGVTACGSDAEEYQAVMVDISGSAVSASLDKRVAGQLDAVMADLPYGSQVLVGVIDGSPLTQECEPVKVDYDPAGESSEVKAGNAKKLREETAAAATRLLECAATSKTPGSDIVGGFAVVGNWLRDVGAGAEGGDDSGDASVLIISDMVQYSPELRLPCKAIGTQEQREAAVGDLESQDLVPDLTDVSVTVEGAGAGAARSSSCAKSTEEFWRAYVGATGGDLVQYDL